MRGMFQHKVERSSASHAILETSSRIRKAQKIISLVSSQQDISGGKLLDIGTGSGHIAHEFSKHTGKVWSVDIVDERKEKRGYTFKQVKDEALPFKDASFDIVVSNHVVEHAPNQAKHLREAYRVLKPGGILYLATPNKYWLTDPHYKLPFISWLPRKASHRYLKAVQGKVWDIYPLSHRGVKKQFTHTEARIENALPLLVKTDANQTLDTMSGVTKIARLLPQSSLVATQYISPTLIYIIKKPI